MTPTDPAKYTKGTEVPAKSEFEKTVKDEDNDGTWTFKSYDHDKQTVEKSDIKFVGTWEFTPNTYPVGYEFKSTDPKRELLRLLRISCQRTIRLISLRPQLMPKRFLTTQFMTQSLILTGRSISGIHLRRLLSVRALSSLVSGLQSSASIR